MLFAAAGRLSFATNYDLFAFIQKTRTTIFNISSLKQSLVEAAKIRYMTRFLFARMAGNDGLVTLFAFGGIYAAKVFNLASWKSFYLPYASIFQQVLGQ